MAEGGHVDENQNMNIIRFSVFDRLASFTLVQSTYQIASLAYRDVKSVHPAVGYVCEVSERGVKVASDLAAMGASPLLNIMAPQIAAVNNVALHMVDELENKLPVLDQPADEVASVFRGRLESGVRTVKERALGRVQNVVDRTRSMAKESYEALSVAASFLETLEVRDMVKVAAYFLVTQAEELVDRYLPEDSDTGGPESSSSSEEIDEIDEARFSLMSRSQELARSIVSRSVRKLRPFLSQYWNFLQSGVSLVLTLPAQVRQCIQAVLWSVLPRKTSKEEEETKRKATSKKKKSEAPSKPSRSPAKAHPNPQQGFLRVTPSSRHQASNTSAGRVRGREGRRQSFDSSFFPRRIQEDVVDDVFNP